jgi:hypothetical protein
LLQHIAIALQKHIEKFQNVVGDVVDFDAVANARELDCFPFSVQAEGILFRDNMSAAMS